MTQRSETPTGRIPSLVRASEAPLAIALGCLALWLALPSMWWAGLAAALGCLSAVAVMGRGRRSRLLVELAVLSGAVAAFATSLAIRSVEVNWADERENLITAASAELDLRLAETLDLAGSLADLATTRDGLSRAESFQMLVANSRAARYEAGVVRFAVDGRPWTWGGRFRVEPRDVEGTRARVTSFFAVLESGARAGSVAASVQVLLWADPSLPNVGESVASAFLRDTGSDLRFYTPAEAPNVADVFDYCVPECSPATGTADTLFSVRAIPPSQGAVKLQLLGQGGDRVAWALVLAVVAAMLFAPVAVKRITVAATTAALIFTPAGGYLGLERLFSPTTFFVGELGPFSQSAGHLILTSALAVIAAVGLWRLGLKRNVFTFAGSVALVAAAPYALRIVAHGITPSSEGEGIALWLSWELVVTVTSSAFMLFAAAIVRGSESEAPPWMSWVAVTWAIGVAVAGLFLWNPGPGAAWPEWYTFVWIPALLLAVQPCPTRRLVPTIAVVAGSAAALLTWGATVEGRMVLADRDVGALGETTDIVVVSSLEEMGAALVSETAPTSVGELFVAWSGSGLRSGIYPAVLIARDALGRETARFDLARFDLDSEAMEDLAVRARASGRPRIESIPMALGLHSVLYVPYEDGSSVTVAVAPRSTLVEMSQTGHLFGIGGEHVPFTVALTRAGGEGDPLEGVSWRRQGWKVVGTRMLLSPGGDRLVTAEVSLLGPGRLLVRGALVVLYDVLGILFLWLVGESLAGRVEILPRLGRPFGGSRYRTRLALVLAAFFVIPTIGFAGWSLIRLRTEAVRGQNLLLAQELAVAAEGLSADPSDSYGDALVGLARRSGSDLVLHEDGLVVATSNPVLRELGLIDLLVPYRAFGPIVLVGGGDVIVRNSGDPLVSVYRGLPSAPGTSTVLAVAGIALGSGFGTPQTDVVFTVVLVALLGLAAASWLANITARSMTRPLQSLREAAAAVGMGQPAPPVMRPIPAELDPVVSAFERMERDVLEHQAALESTVRFTQAVLRHVGTGVVALDRGMRVAAANPRAEDLLAATLASGMEVSGQTPEDWKDVWRWVEGFVAGDFESDVKEFTVGDRRIKVLAGVLEGDEAGCVVVLDDVTDLARAERVLAWGEMARQVAHEIKNPLTPIRLGVQHLQRAHRDGRTDFPAMLDRTSEQILAEIERLDAIARGFSRFGSPAREHTPVESVELLAVARDAAALYQMGSECRVVASGNENARALARKDEFKELLVNLVENSRDADARTVTIEIEEEDGTARVDVTDDGKGISADVIPRIFEPRFSTTTSGTGLGLAISKRLVESWDGSIEVRSTEGKGTAVTIRLRIVGHEPVKGGEIA